MGVRIWLLPKGFEFDCLFFSTKKVNFKETQTVEFFNVGRNELKFTHLHILTCSGQVESKVENK